MLKLSLLTVLIKGFLIFLVVRLPCESCQNAFENIQEFLQNRQLPGRFFPSTGLKLSKQLVFTKMGCLDICLRTAECGSFDVSLTQPRNGTIKPPWICVINRRVNPQDTTPKLGARGQAKGWMHFNATSQELQEVSCCNAFINDKCAAWESF